jgi:hypothetical protein
MEGKDRAVVRTRRGRVDEVRSAPRSSLQGACHVPFPVRSIHVALIRPHEDGPGVVP